MTGVFKRRRKFGHRETDIGKMVCEDGGRDWSPVLTSPGRPKMAGNQWI